MTNVIAQFLVGASDAYDLLAALIAVVIVDAATRFGANQNARLSTARKVIR